LKKVTHYQELSTRMLSYYVDIGFKEILEP
jgi:hypothetical protein